MKRFFIRAKYVHLFGHFWPSNSIRDASKPNKYQLCWAKLPVEEPERPWSPQHLLVDQTCETVGAESQLVDNDLIGVLEPHRCRAER